MFQQFDVALPVFVDRVYNIEEFGAVGDGMTSNTEAFKKTMEAAAVTGGTVYVPDGIWFTGPIRLLSGINLHLADNAVILFSKNPEEYPLVQTDFEGIQRLRTLSPLYADHAENIAITGKGTIDGSGHLWRPVKRFKMTDRQWKGLLDRSPYLIPTREGDLWMPTRTSYEGQLAGEIYPDEENAIERATPYYDQYRPVMIRLDHCKRVLVEDATLQNSPAWCLHTYFCEDLTIRNATITNPYYAQNGDGMDIESCKNVEIAHCKLNVGDDGICIKSGRNKEARKIKGPSENIWVHHCYVGYSHGGFVVGSEMSRGVRNILVEDCTFMDTDIGFRFKSTIGRGGVVENIHIRRVNMVNIKTQAAIFNMDYVLNINGFDDLIVETEDPEDIPIFRDILIEDCTCIHAQQAVKVVGLKWKEPTIHDIHFKNFRYIAEKENTLEACENIIFD